MPRFLRRRQRLATERRSTPSTPGFLSTSVPSGLGAAVTPQSALTFSAYFAGVRVITEDLASLPLQVFRRKRSGGAAVVRDHPATKLFGRSPDGEATALNWRETWQHFAIGWGTGYAEIDWSDDGEPLTLKHIHPTNIRPKRDKAGRLYYELPNNKVAAPFQILNLPMLGGDGITGYSLVKMMGLLIGTGQAQDQYASSFFGNGAWPGGIIEFARGMKPEGIANFKASWNAQHQGPGGAHRVAVLEEGAKWVQNFIPPEQAQMVAARMFTVIDMCRVLRLSPNKLADYAHAQANTVEESNKDHVTSCLRPFACRIDQALDFKLLSDEEWAAGFYFKHDFRPLMLRTAKDTADWYMKMFQIGYYTVDEMRVLEGENPIGEEAGGAKRFVQAQLVDITKAGDPPPKGQEPKPPDAPGRNPRFEMNGFTHENTSN